jgi:hypothetical protein
METWNQALPFDIVANFDAGGLKGHIDSGDKEPRGH